MARLALVLFIFSCSFLARDSSHVHWIFPYKNFYDQNGQKILVFSEEKESFASINKNGEYTIHLGESFMKQVSEDTRWWIFYHELGHILLGHVDNSTISEDFKQFLADEYAFKQIAKHGLDKDIICNDLKKINKVLNRPILECIRFEFQK